MERSPSCCASTQTTSGCGCTGRGSGSGNGHVRIIAVEIEEQLRIEYDPGKPEPFVQIHCGVHVVDR